MSVIKSKKLRDSARDEECTLNITGHCNYDPSTVVLNHLPSEIAGYKSTDLSSCYGCSSCHAVIDSRGSIPDEDYEFYIRRAQVRTITRFYEKGLITIKGAA